MYLPIKAKVVTSAGISSSESPFPPTDLHPNSKSNTIATEFIIINGTAKKKRKVCYYKENILKNTTSQLLASRKDGNTK